MQMPPTKNRTRMALQGAYNRKEHLHKDCQPFEESVEVPPTYEELLVVIRDLKGM